MTRIVEEDPDRTGTRPVPLGGTNIHPCMMGRMVAVSGECQRVYGHGPKFGTAYQDSHRWILGGYAFGRADDLAGRESRDETRHGRGFERAGG
jgi:hypothetical protein